MTGLEYPPPAIPFVPWNCTNYPASGDDYIKRAFINLSACYDYEDSLHIAYVTTMVPVPAGGYYYAYPAWLYHWSKKNGNSLITSTCPEDFEPPGKMNMYPYWWWGTIAGEQNAAISKPSIAALDPIYHPDEDGYLFCIWTQVDTGDVSSAGFGNRDIFGCASSDAGVRWNLTQTPTPGCDAEECVSEAWPSLAQNMYNGDLHIQYICDRDAGPCVWGEGDWTENDVYYLDLEEWDIQEIPGIDYRIEDPPETPNWNKPPLKVPPEGRNLRLKIFSTGNIPVSYSVDDDHDWIFAPGDQPDLNPGDSNTVTITVQEPTLRTGTFVDGNVIINSNDPAQPIIELPLQAVVDVDDYYECPRTAETEDTLDNTDGNTQSGLILYTNANCQEWFHYYDPVADTVHEVGFQGGIIVATIRDDDTLVGRSMGDNDHKADAQDSLYVEQCDWDWEPDFWIVYTKDIFINDLDPPMNDKWFCWEFSKQVKFFTSDAPEPYRNIVIKYIRVKRQAPPGWWPGVSGDCTDYGNTYIGMAMDIDCPYDTMGNQNGRNKAGYDDGREIAYQVGWHNDPGHAYNDFHCGIALAETCEVPCIVPYGSYNVRNDSCLYPQSPWGWLDGELYQLAETPDSNIQAKDTLYGLDRTQVFTAMEIPGGNGPNAEASFTLVEVVAPLGLTQLQEYVDSARAIVARDRQFGGIPAKCGDCNGDYIVDLGDLLWLINYLYKSGPPPYCPFNRGDINSDGVIDMGDMLTLINYLYDNGPEPKCPGIPFWSWY